MSSINPQIHTKYAFKFITQQIKNLTQEVFYVKMLLIFLITLIFVNFGYQIYNKYKLQTKDKQWTNNTHKNYSQLCNYPKIEDKQLYKNNFTAISGQETLPSNYPF